MNANMTRKVENKDMPTQLNSCSFYKQSLLIENVKTVEDFEQYLKTVQTQNLMEGNYHHTVPDFLREKWMKLFDIRAEMVKNSTRHFWVNYKKYAFGCDELAPVTKQCKNNWGGVGMTLIDSLDTLWIMGMKSEFEEAVEYVGILSRYKK